MEAMTGSLGQGLSQAAGVAMGKRLKGEKGRVHVFMSTGSCSPGRTGRLSRPYPTTAWTIFPSMSI